MASWVKGLDGKWVDRKTKYCHFLRMGLLSLGTPLPWPEVKPLVKHIHNHGIKQFLNIFHAVKTRRLDNSLWGEEVLELALIKHF